MAESGEIPLQQNAASPQSVSIDGQTVTQHSLKDQIEADKYLASKSARTKPALAFSRVKIVPPGTV
jgi:hypothetical protein